MKPLFYLWWHQVKNGVLRAIRSPRRTIGLLFLVGFWLLGPLRFVFFPSDRVRIPTNETFELPPVDRIESVVFIGFLVLCWGQLTSLMNRSVAMSQSDLDILMPTPVSSRTILGLRMLRDTLMWLILPIVGLIFGGRGVQSATSLLAQQSGVGGTLLAFKFFTLGYLLFAGVSVVLSYGVTLRLSRQDPITMKRRTWVNWTGWVLSAMVLLVAIALVWIYQTNPWAGVAAVNQTINRILFFPATFATWFVMAPLTGEWARGAVGLAVMGGTLFAAVRYSLNQSGDLYELAASRAAIYGDLMEAARSGDVTRLQQIRAKQGFFRKKRIGWIEKLRWSSIWAPTWRELVLTIRARSYILYTMPGLLLIVMYAMIIATNHFVGGGASLERVTRVLGPSMSGMFVLTFLFILPTKYQNDFGIILRRIDLVKPMPMSDRRLIFSELLARVVIPGVLFFVSMLIAIAAWPSQTVLLMSLSVVTVASIPSVASSTLATMLLFPDMEDKTQAPIRSVVSIFTTLTVLGMIAVPFAALALLAKLPYFVAMLPSIAIAAVLGVVGVLVSARLYRGFDPKV